VRIQIKLKSRTPAAAFPHQAATRSIPTSSIRELGVSLENRSRRRASSSSNWLISCRLLNSSDAGTLREVNHRRLLDIEVVRFGRDKLRVKELETSSLDTMVTACRCALQKLDQTWLSSKMMAAASTCAAGSPTRLIVEVEDDGVMGSANLIERRAVGRTGIGRPTWRAAQGAMATRLHDH
jgi:hypothetical protein